MQSSCEACFRQLIIWKSEALSCIEKAVWLLATLPAFAIGRLTCSELCTQAVSCSSHYRLPLCAHGMRVQSFGSADQEFLTDDEMEDFQLMDSPTKAPRLSLGGPRRSSTGNSLPELKAIHRHVLQPALQYMRAGMLDAEIQPFKVLAACRPVS